MIDSALIKTYKYLLLLIFILIGCSDSSQFSVLDDKPVALLNDERTIYINYWAVWCAPCIEEMPELAAFRSENIERAEVYAVNYDSPAPEQLRQQVERLGVQLPVLLDDPAPLLGVASPEVLPTTLVVRNRKVVEVLLGPQTQESLAKALID